MKDLKSRFGDDWRLYYGIEPEVYDCDKKELCIDCVWYSADGCCHPDLRCPGFESMYDEEEYDFYDADGYDIYSRINKRSRNMKYEITKSAVNMDDNVFSWGSVWDCSIHTLEPEITDDVIYPFGREYEVGLVFTPEAWRKLYLLFLFGKSQGTEVSCFGLSRNVDLNKEIVVSDILVPKQEVGCASIDFDEEDLVKFLEDMLKKGYKPNEVMRVWIHTHPGFSPSPSGTDKSTFRDVFGFMNWAVMAILSEENMYAELHKKGAKTSQRMDVGIQLKEDDEQFIAYLGDAVCKKVYVSNLTKKTDQGRKAGWLK